MGPGHVLRPLPKPSPTPRRQLGAGAVEFALVALVFFTLLLGVVDFGRWLFTMNAASEATRLGARVAVVCDQGSNAVLARMQQFLPGLTAGEVRIEYFASNAAEVGEWTNGCSFTDCAGVRVQLDGYTIPGIAWFLPAGLPVPSFPTALTRESLRSQIAGSPNPICQVP
jgi:Flp pilus assembly protein TadG